MLKLLVGVVRLVRLLSRRACTIFKFGVSDRIEIFYEETYIHTKEEQIGIDCFLSRCSKGECHLNLPAALPYGTT
jgi:hypothetical protein